MLRSEEDVGLVGWHWMGLSDAGVDGWEGGGLVEWLWMGLSDVRVEGSLLEEEAEGVVNVQCWVYCEVEWRFVHVR